MLAVILSLILRLTVSHSREPIRQGGCSSEVEMVGDEHVAALQRPADVTTARRCVRRTSEGTCKHPLLVHVAAMVVTTSSQVPLLATVPLARRTVRRLVPQWWTPEQQPQYSRLVSVYTGSSLHSQLYGVSILLPSVSCMPMPSTRPTTRSRRHLSVGSMLHQFTILSFTQ